MSSRHDPPPFRPIPELSEDEAWSEAPVEIATDAQGRPLDPEADTSAGAAAGRARLRAGMQVPLLVLGFIVAVGLVTALTTREGANAQRAPDASAPAAPEPAIKPSSSEAYSFRRLDIHPDRLFRDYFDGAFLSDPAAAGGEMDEMSDFRWRLEMFRKAYGVDDNFTIRVFDERTGRDLETLTLRDLRDEYERTGIADWDAVNRARRTATSGLRQKWQDRGVPRQHIVIRWGYANQSLESRERDAPFLDYEVQLARRLGLSLLATEIGTVETFNQDWLVSSAGARSRYQMMPDILELFNVERYDLRTTGGSTVKVAEELHPLLSMEPSLMLVRAYSNAVGHELPGVSAYHTGVANIHKLYREYLRAHPLAVRSEQHVSDAYMWGVTDGFEAVDAVSSFGPHSRIYVLKAYGALRATENEVIEPKETAHVERVQLKPGATITLGRILEALGPHTSRLDWSYADSGSLYQRFRTLNPHIKLPAAGGSGVPPSGDVVFVSESGGDPVRFFLPDGSKRVLDRVGLDVIGEITEFDEDTFEVGPGERTRTDRAYEDLVEDIGRFGFTRANKARLERIYDQMQALARQNPDSRFRQTQAKIAQIHRTFWRTSAFESLLSTREALLSINPLDLRNDSLAQGPLLAPLF